MASLLPQFKCPIHCLDTELRSPHHTFHLNARVLVHFQTKCASSQMTAVVENLQMTTLEADPNSSISTRPLTYVGAIGPPVKKKFEENLAREAFLASEEAVMAAAAEAIALAKSAVEVAKKAARLLESNPFLKFNKLNDFIVEDEEIAADMITENEIKQINWRNYSAKIDSMSDYCDIPHKISVRSKRQTERKVRRARAAAKNITTNAYQKLQSSGKKKGDPLQEVDYSDPLRYIRGTANTSKLLTAAEEQQLSEGIQDLIKLERIQEELAERIGSEPTMTQWAAAAGLDTKTLRKHLTYGSYCKDKMIKSNVRLVISIAKNFQGAGMSIQDLVQEGCRGLLRGAEKFDASKGFKFSTYAHWWIRQAIRKSLSDQSRTIRLPYHMVDASYRVRDARKQLYSERGRHPDDEEVAEAAGLSMRMLTAVMLTPKSPISLDQKIGTNQSLKPSEVTADPEALTSEEILIRQFMKDDLNKILDSLTPREKQVVRWRFGLEDGRMKTLQEIGEMIGVSRERIRQIESCAFRKLKNKNKTDKLKQYLYF